MVRASQTPWILLTQGVVLCPRKRVSISILESECVYPRMPRWRLWAQFEEQAGDWTSELFVSPPPCLCSFPPALLPGYSTPLRVMGEKGAEEALGQTWAFGVGVLEKLKLRLGQEGASGWGQNMGAAFPGRGNGVNEQGGEQERHRNIISLHHVTLLQPQQRMWMPLALWGAGIEPTGTALLLQDGLGDHPG